MSSRPLTGGFTLVEVLVAMAIVSVSFLALYGSMQQIVQSTTLMQDKSFATWVAQDQLAELRLAAQLPEGETLTGTRTLGGIDWQYTASLRTTESESVRQIIVRVTPLDNPAQELGLVTGVLLIQPGAISGNFGDSGAALVSSRPGDAGLLNPAEPDSGETPVEGVLE